MDLIESLAADIVGTAYYTCRTIAAAIKFNQRLFNSQEGGGSGRGNASDHKNEKGKDQEGNVLAHDCLISF